MTSESRSDNAQVFDGLWPNSTGKEEDHCESIGQGRKLILSNTVQGWGESPQVFLGQRHKEEDV